MKVKIEFDTTESIVTITEDGKDVSMETENFIVMGRERHIPIYTRNLPVRWLQEHFDPKPPIVIDLGELSKEEGQKIADAVRRCMY